MLADAKIASFVATADAAAAREFYENVLGLEFIDDEPYALVFNAAGTTLRIQKVDEVAVAPYTAIGWHVTDIAAVITGLKKRGVDFIFFDGFGQDELGIVTFPGGAKVAWFKDPDGNTLSLDEFASA
jgi:catechol 2,3-dioxygenase-like lactoylglutathione lyase family enzyme